MRTKLIDSSIENSPGYGAGSGDTERYEYECPCGKGKIIEEHDNTPENTELYMPFSFVVSGFPVKDFLRRM